MARATNSIGQGQTTELILNPAGYHHNVMQSVTFNVPEENIMRTIRHRRARRADRRRRLRRREADRAEEGARASTRWRATAPPATASTTSR